MSYSSQCTRLRLGVLLLAVWACSTSELARAQVAVDPPKASKSTSKKNNPKKPTAVLLATAGESAPALDAVIQATLEDLDVVEIVAVPGMDLPGTQLALDCVGETVRCLKRVASESDAQVLIAPTLQRTPSELVLSVLRFDLAGDGSMRRALRRHDGGVVEAGLLDAVPSLLRELFDLPEPEPKVAEQTPPPEAAAPDPFATAFPPDEPPESSVPVGPIVLASVGAAVLGGGIAMGVVTKDKQDEYESRSRGVQTADQADAAIDLRDEGETQGILANVLLAAGGATLVAAGIWFAVELTDQSESASAFAPVLGPNQAGLVFVHRGDAL